MNPPFAVARPLLGVGVLRPSFVAAHAGVRRKPYLRPGCALRGFGERYAFARLGRRRVGAFAPALYALEGRA